jgi:hypothetical protein
LTEITVIKEQWRCYIEAYRHQEKRDIGGKMAPAQNSSRGRLQGRFKRGAKILLFLTALVFLNQLAKWLADLIAFQFWPRHLDMAILMFCTSAFAYILLLAIPFLPGIEIGLMLMAILGRPGIVVIYFCTLLALSLSFLFGRLLPPEVLARVLGWFHLEQACTLVENLAPLDVDERRRFLLESAPSRLTPIFFRHRYLIIALLFNLPGNALIGGGGGIGLVAGMSRMFPFSHYFLLITLAILPGPVFFLLRTG